VRPYVRLHYGYQSRQPCFREASSWPELPHPHPGHLALGRLRLLPFARLDRMASARLRSGSHQGRRLLEKCPADRVRLQGLMPRSTDEDERAANLP
jgi:hypothetical protein